MFMSSQHLFLCAAVAEDVPHQAQAGQEGQTEPTNSTVDPFPHRQQDQVSELFRDVALAVAQLLLFVGLQDDLQNDLGSMCLES